MAGVRDEFIELRRRLRDDGPDVPIALKRGGDASAATRSISVLSTSITEEPLKRQRKNRTCFECSQSGRGQSLIRQIGNGKGIPIRFICSDPRCSQYEEIAPAIRPMPCAPVKRKRVRHCKYCSSRGFLFEEIQIGYRENTRFLCSNPDGCVASEEKNDLHNP